MQKRLRTVNSLKSFADDNPQRLRSISHNVCVNLTCSSYQSLQEANNRGREDRGVSGDIQWLEPKQILLARSWATWGNSDGQFAVTWMMETARQL
jgi:hypothetical protein